jgi:hypothetical protein
MAHEEYHDDGTPVDPVSKGYSAVAFWVVVLIAGLIWVGQHSDKQTPVNGDPDCYVTAQDANTGGC